MTYVSAYYCIRNEAYLSGNKILSIQPFYRVSLKYSNKMHNRSTEARTRSNYAFPPNNNFVLTT